MAKPLAQSIGWRRSILNVGDTLHVHSERFNGEGIFLGISPNDPNLFCINVNGKAEWMNQVWVSYPQPKQPPISRFRRNLY